MIPVPAMLTSGASPGSPHLCRLRIQNEIGRIRLKVSKHRCDFRNMVDICYLARRVLNAFLP